MHSRRKPCLRRRTSPASRPRAASPRRKVASSLAVLMERTFSGISALRGPASRQSRCPSARAPCQSASAR
eukprot:8302532-Pyramimonas_sp.AAC.1